ncbi:hypothetical protein JCM8097_009279 [Rhodosporidiobolus ruineniae]
MSLLRVLPAAHLARSLSATPTLAAPLRAALTTSSPSLLPAPSSRLLSTSSVLATSRASLAASAGSGQGGKREKEAARKEKERERARKDKEREKARKDREKAQAQREKDKAWREKEKLKLEKEKEKAKKLKDKERAEKEKAKEQVVRTRSKLHPPKAPGNSWQIFFADYLAEHKANVVPGTKVSLTELVKEATPKYQSLSEDDKAALKARAEEQKRDYPAILEAWKQTLTPEMIREENVVRANRRKLGLSKKRALKIEGEPKRPITGFFRFSQELREQGDAFDGETDILKQSKIIAAKWRELPEEEKKPYNDAYAADKERYERERAEFEASIAKPSSA